MLRISSTLSMACVSIRKVGSRKSFVFVGLGSKVYKATLSSTGILLLMKCRFISDLCCLMPMVGRFLSLGQILPLVALANHHSTMYIRDLRIMDLVTSPLLGEMVVIILWAQHVAYLTAGRSLKGLIAERHLAVNQLESSSRYLSYSSIYITNLTSCIQQKIYCDKIFLSKAETSTFFVLIFF